MPVNPAVFLSQTLLALVLAKLLAELCERRGLPSVLGEILAGWILGAGWLGFNVAEPGFSALACAGAVLLLFRVGLSLERGRVLAAGLPAAAVALLSAALPFAAVYLLLSLQSQRGGLVVVAASAFSGASLLLAARALDGSGASSAPSAPFIAAVLSLQNLLVAAVLPALLTFSSLNADWPKLAAAPLLAAGFLAAVFVAGPDLSRVVLGWLERSRTPGALTCGLAAFALLLAAIGERMGAGWAIGALAGGIIAGLGERRAAAAAALKPVSDFLVPLAFVALGAQMRYGFYGFPKSALFLWASVLGLAAAACAAKALAGWACWAPGVDRARLAVALLPAGELGLGILQSGADRGYFGINVRTGLFAAISLTILAGAALQRRAFPQAQ